MNPPTAKKFCKKCNAETERGSRGRCKRCACVYTASWSAANHERKKASIAAWRAANRDAIAAYRTAWSAANQERKKACLAAWNAANPEARRINEQNRRARKREVGGKLSPALSNKLYKLQKGKCACGCKQSLGDDYHMDHIMPLALGGTNTDDNMQLLRKQCNLQKHAKHPVDFMQSRGFLL